jgi:hypothetical protein
MGALALAMALAMVLQHHPVVSEPPRALAAPCAAAPDGATLVGNGYCLTPMSGGTQRVGVSLCISHECAAYTAASCGALCQGTAGCTGFMVQDMSIYGQQPTCGIVGAAKPAGAPAGAWQSENAGHGTHITGHDAETRDCCYSQHGGGGGPFTDLGEGYCTGAGGSRVQTFLCDDSGPPPPPGAPRCPSTSAACAALCSADAQCAGYMLQNMSMYQRPPTCQLVTPAQPGSAVGGAWLVQNSGGGFGIAGRDGETRDTCYRKSGAPAPPGPPAPPTPSPPAPPSPAPPAPPPGPGPLPGSPRYPQQADMFAVHECAAGSPRQAWAYSAPGLWANGSFSRGRV